MTTSAVRTVGQPSGVRVTGIVPPIPTPFLDGRIDLDSLRRMLDELFDSVDGVLVGGSTGEAASLTVAEREAAIGTVAAHFGGERSLVVSVADNSIENSRRLSEVAGESGADLLVVSCPTYFPNDQQMLESYFGYISDFASADICLYDNPVASNTQLSVDQILALLAAVPRLTHIKVTDTALGKVEAISDRASVTIHAGDDSVLWHQLRGGAEGTMTAIAMVYPEKTATMWRSFRAGDVDDAYRVYRELSHFIHCCLSSLDYPAVVKTVFQRRGILASAEVRTPLRPLSRARLEEVVAAY
ncbi:MAG TPA: dihydrodipicolinate synthase family protein [Gaiellaceae bacterium]|nr:dihydrodipicolinate synthase family protein [Gaiellaceae bacterium]